MLSEGIYVDDVRTGPWADYYESGSPKYLYTLKESSREGLFQSFHPNARLETAGHFVAGYQFGQWRFYDRAGKLTETGAFSNDHREGRWTRYHGDGSPKLIELYFKGQRVGHWQLLNSDGTTTDVWNDMPEGVAWASEAWPVDGTPRREGFLQGGQPVGLWKTYHRDGLLRSIGTFENGEASGPWHFFNQDAELIARGAVRRGRPTGEWTIASGGASRVVEARTTFGGGMPLIGEWSLASLADAEPVGVVVQTWLEEAASPVALGAVVDQSRPKAPVDGEESAAPEPPSPKALAAMEKAVQESAALATVPTPTHAFTDREKKAYGSLVKYYGGVKGALVGLQSLYRSSSSSSRTSKAQGMPEIGGDVARAELFVGKKLPMTILRSPSGEEFNLNKRRGQKIVLVLLRGYDGEICPYCVAQTEALCVAGALQEFKERNVALEVVFPGTKNGLDAFQEAYRNLSKKSRNAYGMRFANAFDIASKFDLPGAKVRPTTLLVDERGIVRYAYVGATVEDRPPLPLLLEEIDRMDAE